jgi:arginine exporter protein ArgO
MITSFILGAVVASVVWFFVWRNNKNLIAKKLEDLDKVVSSIETTEVGANIKEKVDKIFKK